VTHDQVEALSLGDRIAVMKDGQIVQCDTPMKIYDEPASVFVGSFIGTPPMNFLRGTVQVSDGQVAVHLGDFHLRPAETMGAHLKSRADHVILVGIRPENIVVHLWRATGALPATVLVVEPLGSHKLLTVQAGKETLKVTTRADAPVEANQEVWLEFEAGKIRWLEETSGQAL
jgi:multiple sugar transport system ATP-binding protein